MLVLVVVAEPNLRADVVSVVQRYGAEALVAEDLSEMHQLRENQPEIHAICLAGDDDEETLDCLLALRTMWPVRWTLALLSSQTTHRIPILGLGQTDFIIVPDDQESLPARLALLLRCAEEAFAKEAQELEGDLFLEVIESVGELVEVSSPTGVIEYVNDAVSTVLGYHPGELTARRQEDALVLDPRSEGSFDARRKTVNEGKSWQGITIVRHKNGAPIHLETNVSPVLDPDGNVEHHVAVARDISERIRSQRVLQQAYREVQSARDQAIEANRVKSQFLATMSHELRTPLNAVIGYSEMLKEELTDLAEPALVDDAEQIRVAGRHLLRVISEILDISRIEAGQLEIVLEDFDLNGAIDAVVDHARALDQVGHTSFQLHVAPELGTMRSDLARFRQILIALIDNAIKFGEGTSIEVAATTDDEMVEVSVRDHGVGLSEAQQAIIFKPFVQGDSSSTRRYGGTGLGLAICQKLAGLLGGEITVESTLGEGALFTLRLPTRAR